jgi:ABC-2 type transport system ATP-binding protein
LAEASMSTSGVTIERVTVHRGGRPVLHAVSASLTEGLVTGLFGPSGSGKSTLIRAIAGVQARVEGTVTVFGQAPGSAAARRQLGYKTQATSIYEDLTVAENVRYFATLHDAEVGELLARVGLERDSNRLVRNLSGGQQARVSLAAALAGGPRLLLLDEPTVGLDPLLRRELWQLFAEIARERGAALLVSSHVLDEARHCDLVLLMRDGRILAQCTPGQLMQRTGTDDMDEAFVRLIEAA